MLNKTNRRKHRNEPYNINIILTSSKSEKHQIKQKQSVKRNQYFIQFLQKIHTEQSIPNIQTIVVAVVAVAFPKTFGKNYFVVKFLQSTDYFLGYTLELSELRSDF